MQMKKAILISTGIKSTEDWIRFLIKLKKKLLAKVLVGLIKLVVNYEVCVFFLVVWFFQAERFIERKVDQAEKNIKKQGNKAKRWYSGLLGEESKCQLTDAQIFIISFVGGLALGMATSK